MCSNDPQRGVGLDQTPLRVATTSRYGTPKILDGPRTAMQTAPRSAAIRPGLRRTRAGLGRTRAGLGRTQPGVCVEPSPVSRRTQPGLRRTQPGFRRTQPGVCVEPSPVSPRNGTHGCDLAGITTPTSVSARQQPRSARQQPRSARLRARSARQQARPARQQARPALDQTGCSFERVATVGDLRGQLDQLHS
jgi:hypothetical protein